MNINLAIGGDGSRVISGRATLWDSAGGVCRFGEFRVDPQGNYQTWELVCDSPAEWVRAPDGQICFIR